MAIIFEINLYKVTIHMSEVQKRNISASSFVWYSIICGRISSAIFIIKVVKLLLKNKMCVRMTLCRKQNKGKA